MSQVGTATKVGQMNQFFRSQIWEPALKAELQDSYRIANRVSVCGVSPPLGKHRSGYDKYVCTCGELGFLEGELVVGDCKALARACEQQVEASFMSYKTFFDSSVMRRSDPTIEIPVVLLPSTTTFADAKRMADNTTRLKQNYPHYRLRRYQSSAEFGEMTEARNGEYGGTGSDSDVGSEESLSPSVSNVVGTFRNFVPPTMMSD